MSGRTIYAYVGNNPINATDPSGNATSASEARSNFGGAFDDLMFGGFGQRARQSREAGDYGQWAMNLGAGTVFAVANVVTLGDSTIAMGMVRAGEGGAFGLLKARAIVGDGLEAHHIPQTALNFTSREEGGALVMTAAEHMDTRTWFGKGAVTAVQDAGKAFRDVVASDFRDVRRIVGNKYNEGLSTIADYYRKNFPELMAKPPGKP